MNTQGVPEQEPQQASIAVLFPNGEVTAVSVRNLGGLENLGQTLHEHYTDRMKILKLIGLGDLLSVGSELGRAQDLDRMEPRLQNRNFQELVRDQCIAVGRDREGLGSTGERREYTDTTQWDREFAQGHRYLYNGSTGGTGEWSYRPPVDAPTLAPPGPLWAAVKIRESSVRLRGGRPIIHPGPVR